MNVQITMINTIENEIEELKEKRKWEVMWNALNQWSDCYKTQIEAGIFCHKKGTFLKAVANSKKSNQMYGW